MINNQHSSFDYSAITQHFQNEAKLLKKYGAVYLEGEADKYFWQSIFEYTLLPSIQFEYYYNSNINNEIAHSGSNECFKFAPYTSKHFLICIDSDYHNVLSTLPITKNDFIFETYTYSFENHLCYPDNIAQLINHVSGIVINNEIEKFINLLSPLCFELLAHSIASEFLHCDDLFFRRELNEIFRIDNIGLSLDDIRNAIETKINVKIASLTYIADDIESARNFLYNTNINEYNSYLYIRGHSIYDNCIYKLISEIINERLKTLPLTERQTFLMGFQNQATKPRQRVFAGYAEINKIVEDINRLIINHLF